MEPDTPLFRKPLAPELTPSMTAGAAIVCAWLIVSCVSVCMSNKNNSKTLALPVYPAFCNLKS